MEQVAVLNFSIPEEECSVLAGLCSYINLDFLLLIMQQKLVLFSLSDMYLKVSSFAMCNVESESLNPL